MLIIRNPNNYIEYSLSIFTTNLTILMILSFSNLYNHYINNWITTSLVLTFQSYLFINSMNIMNNDIMKRAINTILITTSLLFIILLLLIMDIKYDIDIGIFMIIIAGLVSILDFKAYDDYMSFQKKAKKRV